jgi:predicted short-subunit dehydrogenase-like oxidoreductase (DUF2520 family)
MDVAVVGAGRVGTAFAVLLSRAGHRIAAVAGRDATSRRARRHLPGVPVVPAAEAARGAELVLLGTPDDLIGPTCRELGAAGAFAAGRTVAHLSGATPLAALEPARAAGSGTLSIHPLQTFPDVEAAVERIPGSAIAVTAEDEETAAVGDRLAGDVGGRPFRLPDDAKPLYHAAAVFASNYLVTVSALAEELFAAAGVGDPLAAFLPLSRATLDNVERLGPAAALTGPALRGDAGTVARNLEALGAAAPGAVAAYVELAGVALDLGERSGRLDPERRRDVEEVLARWR